MNREYVLYHLKEAHEELTKTIREIEQDPDYNFGEYIVAMTHLYHHINTAWNAKDATPEQADRCSEEDFERWRQFPSDIDLSAD